MSSGRAHSLSLVLALAVAAPAAAQPTLSKVFTPNTIGPGSVSRTTFTITNGGGSPVSDLAFTDVLPAAVTIANPANASTTCLDGVVTAPAGGSSIALSGGKLGGGGATCTVSVGVTASTPGAHTNPAVTLNSSAGSSMSLPVDLTVASNRPGFSKSFAPSSIALGGRSTLTLTIDNSANASALAFLSFTDNFPAGLEIADPASAATDCGGANAPPTLTAAAGSSALSLTVSGFAFAGFYAMEAGATCSVTVDVVATSTGMLENVTGELSIRTGTDPTIYSAGAASATLDVPSTPLAIQKAFVDDPVPPGGTATLNFQIDNFDRGSSATDLAFTDDLAATLAGLTFSTLEANDCGGSVSGLGTTTITLAGGTLASEGSCAISVKLSVPGGATPGPYTNTTSAVSATVGGSPVVGNVASDDLFVEPIPLLTKTFVGDPVKPGDTVDLQFTVTNTSTTSSATDIAFQDLFDVVMRTASVTPGNDCCGAGSTCAFTPLSDPPGGTTFPATLSISGGSLAPAGMAGDSCSFSITLDVDAGAAAGIYPNVTTAVTATVDGATRTGEPATDNLTVISAPTLSKAFVGDPVAPGGTATLEFTLSYPADAGGDATAISFTDDLDAALTGLTANLPATPDPPCGAGSTLTGSAGDSLLTLMGGTLSPGSECTFSVTVNVPLATAPDLYTNTTSGVSATVDGQAATSAPASDDLKVAGLAFSKEFLGDPVLPGDTVNLRFTLENISPTDGATNIAFSDNLAAVLPGTPDLSTSLPGPVNTCGGTGTLIGSNLSYSGGTLAVGQTCTIEIVVTVPAGAADGDYINTTSNLTATIGGGTVIIGPAIDTLSINANVLSLTKAFTDDPVAPGDPVTLEYTLTNLDSAQVASAIGFVDDLGAALPGLTFDSVLSGSTCGGTVTGTTSTTLSVSNVSLGAGASCLLRASLSVPGASAAGIYPSTSGAVTGSVGGFAATGDPASDDLVVLQLLAFGKSFDGPTTAGGTATLTFTITNPGSDSVAGIAFSDDLDAVITGLIATSLPTQPCGASSSISGVGTLAFTGGELPPMGGMCSFDVDVLVPANATAGTFPSATSDLSAFGLKVADPATADLEIEPPPTFAKAFAPDSILPGGVSTLTFTIDNSASALAASGLAFVDNLPAGLVVATPANQANTCAGTLGAVAGSDVISLSGGSVGAGATCTLQADVTAAAVGVLVNVTGDLTSSSGNSGTASDTLNVLDVVPPQVTGVNSVSDTGDGQLAACETANVRIVSLLVSFSEPMFDVPMADTDMKDVTNPANYMVVGAGPNAEFDTLGCGPVAADDVDIAVGAVTYDSGTFTATVSLNGGAALRDDLYQVFACSELSDVSSNALDGDKNGTGGDDFVMPFRMERANALANGSMDCDLAGWDLSSTDPAEITHDGAVDVDASSSSGSAHFENLTSSTTFAMSQCVAATPAASEYELSGALRLDAMSVTATLLCRVYDQAGCTGTLLDTAVVGAVSLDKGGSSGVFVPLTGSVTTTPATLSLRCGVDVVASGGAGFDVYVDSLFLEAGAPLRFFRAEAADPDEIPEGEERDVAAPRPSGAALGGGL